MPPLFSIVGVNAMRLHSLRNYAVLPPILFNVWSVLLYGGYYALAAVNPQAFGGVTLGQITFINYVFVVTVELALALSILHRLRAEGVSLRRFATRTDSWLAFRPLPALGAVLAALLVAAIYFILAVRVYGDTIAASYVGLATWQRLTILLVVPATAAFCEELIWRAFIPREMEARRYRFRSIVTLASLSFALIHGIFLPDKVLMTFLLGVILALYFLRERNLLPAIVAHWLIDTGSFGFLLFR